MPNLQFGFQIDFVIVFCAQTVTCLGTILAHHDHWRLNRGETGENQVKKNKWIRIKRARHQDYAINGNPDDEYCAKTNEKFPTAAELCDSVGESFAESEFLFELFLKVTRENLVLLQALDHFLVK